MRPPTWDPLDAADYLEHCLLSSPLDSWFEGPLPTVSPSKILAVHPQNISAVLADAKHALKEPFKAVSFTYLRESTFFRRIPDGYLFCPFSQKHPGSYSKTWIAISWHSFTALRRSVQVYLLAHLKQRVERPLSRTPDCLESIQRRAEDSGRPSCNSTNASYWKRMRCVWLPRSKPYYSRWPTARRQPP